MARHFKEEQTLVLVKPDGLMRGLVGEIIGRFERVGLKMVGLKMVWADKEHLEKHYTLDPNWRLVTGEKTIKNYKEKGLTPPSEDPYEITAKILQGLTVFMSATPLVAMVWQGAHAVKLVRKIVGGTEPLSSDVGTIRGDFVLDSYLMCDLDGRAIRNTVHASGSLEDAEKEIAHWFEEKEIHRYKTAIEAILYDINLDGREE